MSISNAFERDGFVVVFNETGNQCANIQIGSEPGDGLMGYTSTTVNVRDGNFSKSFDERGNQIGSKQIDDMSSRSASGSGCLGVVALFALLPLSGLVAWTHI